MKFKAVVKREFGDITVEAVTDAAVDRDFVAAWGLPDTKSGEKLAERLSKAIEDGAATPNPVVKTDVNGKTYVSTDVVLIGRYMNSGLKQLGY